MKKLIILTILLAVFVGSFSQRIYEPKHYKDEAYKNNIISVSLSPHKLGLGLIYTSKPLFEFIAPISLINSFEIGFYAESESSFLKIFKMTSGLSAVIRNFNFSLAPSVNLTQTSVPSLKYKLRDVSFEIGAMTKLNKTYISIYVDPLLLEAKLGIGLGF